MQSCLQIEFCKKSVHWFTAVIVENCLKFLRESISEGKGGIVNWGNKRGITRSIKCARGGRGVRPMPASLRSWAFLLAKSRNPLQKRIKLSFSVTWQNYYPEQNAMENTNLSRYRQLKRLHVRNIPEGEPVSQQDQTRRPDKDKEDVWNKTR